MCKNLPDNESVFTNKLYSAPDLYSQFASIAGEPVYVKINEHVFTLAPHAALSDGIAASKV
jgi:hypothetical protein